MSGHIPMVSVIIPTCNRARFIHRALKSVSDQTFTDYEIIVVDDCSDDNTEDVIKELKISNIRYLRHSERKGGSAARNTGIGVSSGRYIAFLDDDDEWLPEKLTLQIEIFGSKQNLGMVYTGYHYVDDVKNKIINTFIPVKKGYIYQDLLNMNCVGTTSSAIIRKECFDSVGIFDDKLPACQDWDMWIRISKCFEVEYIDQPLLKFYVHNNRITRNVEAKINGRKILLEKYHDDIEKNNEILSIHYFTIGYYLCHIGKTANGRDEICKAIKLYKYNLTFYVYFFLSLFGPYLYPRLVEFKSRINNRFA